MSTANSQPAQALFTVCADPKVVESAMSASAALPGSLFVGEFKDYISADKRPQFPHMLKAASSCVALIDFDSNPDLALQTAERLHQIFPKRVHVVAAGSKIDADHLLRAMRAGCSEFLSKPFEPKQLIPALERFQLAVAGESKTLKSRRKILIFFGAKGGVGVTTLAVHLATTLLRRDAKKVLLIDHQHELGHVALYLGLNKGQYHFKDLVHNADRLDADLLRGFVDRHDSGLEVLPSPDACSEQHEATRQETEHVLEFLRREYDYVLIDSSLHYGDSKLFAIEQADEVFLIATPDVAALRDLARHAEHLSLIGAETSKLRVVINRSTSDDAVTAEQIQEAVRFPVTVTVPNNYGALVKAINDGEPISHQKRGDFTVSLNRWADQIQAGDSNLSVESTTRKKSLAFWK